MFVTASSMLVFSPGHLRAIIQATLGGYGFETSTDSHLYLGVYLLAGIVYAIYSDSIDINRWLASIFAGVLVMSLAISMVTFKIMSPIVLPYVSCQERCHPLEAFYASFAKAIGRLVCWVANGSLIHTKSGCFQQRIDLLQRLGFAMRASS